MASSFSPSEELFAELLCCICRDSYTDPVDLRCGHIFCRQCVLSIFKAVVKDESPTRTSTIHCPVCRRNHRTSVSAILQMPVNLKLRNIISAFDDKQKMKPATCDVHNKPHVIFCFDCDVVKCLSCFLQSCPPSHNTEELDEMAKQLRSKIEDKVKECSEVNRLADAEIKDLKLVTTKHLSCLSIKMESLRMELDEANFKERQTFKDKMEDLLKLPDSMLVVQKQDVELAHVAYGDDVRSVDDICKVVLEDLHRCVRKMEDVLESYGRDLVCAGDCHPTVKQAAEGNHRSTHGDVCCSPDADPASSVSPDVCTTVSMAIGGVENESGLLTSRPLPCMLGAQSNSQEPLAHTYNFKDFMINSVSTIQGRFTASTGMGLHPVYPQFGQCLPHEYVQAACQISPDKILLITSNILKIHKIDSLPRNNPVFVIPPPLGSPEEHQFDCVAVAGSKSAYYLASDVSRAEIQIWDSTPRRWLKAINVALLANCETPQFKMCAREDVVYISLHDQNEVMAITIQGGVIWSNKSSVRMPNGMAVDNNWLYVCDEAAQHSIALIDREGTLQLRVFESLVEKPWSVAVMNGKMAVLERYHRHYLRMSPIKIKVFNFHLGA